MMGRVDAWRRARRAWARQRFDVDMQMAELRWRRRIAALYAGPSAGRGGAASGISISAS